MAETNAKILKQVEFYFSDSNLPTDKFLKEEIAVNDGWARIGTLASFTRMRKISEDVEVITAALRESKELLEVSEDGLKVRRKTELPENVDLSPFNIYIKGFDNEKTLDEVTAFLEEKGFAPKCVRMRFYKDKTGKKFKGSIFVELADEEAVKSALEKEIKVDDKVYIIKRKSDYLAEKAAEKTAQDATEEVTKFSATDFTKDLLIKVAGVAAEVRRETLKEWVDKVGGKVAFCEFQMGQSEGVIRLDVESEIKAKAVAEKLTASAADFKAENGDVEPTFVALEADDELKAWENIEAAKAERRSNMKSQNKRKGGRDNQRGGGNKRFRR